MQVSIDFFQKHHFQVNRSGSYPIFNSTLILARHDAIDYTKTTDKKATIVDSITQERIWPQEQE